MAADEKQADDIRKFEEIGTHPAANFLAIGEALTFSEKCGLDPVAAMHVLANGAPGSPLVKTVGARMMARDYAVNFFLRLMRKDVNYASQEARLLRRRRYRAPSRR